MTNRVNGQIGMDPPHAKDGLEGRSMKAHKERGQLSKGAKKDRIGEGKEKGEVKWKDRAKWWQRRAEGRCLARVKSSRVIEIVESRLDMELATVDDARGGGHNIYHITILSGNDSRSHGLQ